MNWKIDSVKSMFLSGYKYCNEIFVVVTDVDLSDHFCVHSSAHSLSLFARFALDKYFIPCYSLQEIV